MMSFPGETFSLTAYALRTRNRGGRPGGPALGPRRPGPERPGPRLPVRAQAPACGPAEPPGRAPRVPDSPGVAGGPVGAGGGRWFRAEVCGAPAAPRKHAPAPARFISPSRAGGHPLLPTASLRPGQPGQRASRGLGSAGSSGDRRPAGRTLDAGRTGGASAGPALARREASPTWAPPKKAGRAPRESSRRFRVSASASGVRATRRIGRRRQLQRLARGESRRRVADSDAGGPRQGPSSQSRQPGEGPSAASARAWSWVRAARSECRFARPVWGRALLPAV